MAEMESVAAQKARLRAEFREIRAGLGETWLAEASAAICARASALARELDARTAEPLTVSAFWPLPGEVDLRPLIESLARGGTTVALPVAVSAPGEAPRLEHRRFEGEGRLGPGRFGVREPDAGCARLGPEAVDLAIVPALAATREGVRLGYGGGFYDAFLAQTGALAVGVVVDACLVADLPSEAHDARLDAVVTERETIRISPR